MVTFIPPRNNLRQGSASHADSTADNAVACIVRDVDAEGEVRLGFHGRNDSPWPAEAYHAIPSQAVGVRDGSAPK